jgi:magnesium-transporting ATPase (P-type)
MGKSGTDVARETSDLVITDDNFASIVAGVEEGRIAYANVRKVIFLLISTGAAELVLFTLALLTAQPLPLLAVQLLWLNLVTNGIQDVALAFEPAEGDELRHPPRSPRESIFNRLMIERVVISALVIGTIAFFTFQWLLVDGCGLSDERDDAHCSPTDGAGERDAADRGAVHLSGTCRSVGRRWPIDHLLPDWPPTSQRL